MAFFCFSDKFSDFQPLGSWERITTTGWGSSAFLAAVGGSAGLAAGLSVGLDSWAMARRDSKDARDNRARTAANLWNMVRTPNREHVRSGNAPGRSKGRVLPTGIGYGHAGGERGGFQLG